MTMRLRMWDKKSKKMRKIDSIAFDSEGNVKLVNAWGYDIIEDKDIIVRREKGFVLLPYTGVQDKHGTEICKGDIYHMGDRDITYTVVWHDSGLIGKQNRSSSYAGLESWQRNIEVLGNIYENPELLQ